MKNVSLLIATLTSISCQAADGSHAMPKCIGYASVDRQGTIHLNLISTEPTHGGAMLLIDKTHRLYEEVRKHVGSLRPQAWKCIRPWKDVDGLGVNARTGVDERQSEERKN